MPTLVRLSRNSGYPDRIRQYRVFVDERQVETIGNGETKSFPVAPGLHKLRLKIDWCSSNSMDFEINSGQTINFRCYSSLRGWRLAFAIFVIVFNPRGYICLTRI
jgi:hypothetical protein